MIRPISLFLLACFFLAEYKSFENVQAYGIWAIVLLCIAPVITVLIAPRVLQIKYGIELLTFLVLILWCIAMFLFAWMPYVRTVVGENTIADEVIIVLPVVLSLSLLWWLSSPIKNRFAWVSHRLRVDVLLLFVPMFVLWGTRDVVRNYASGEVAQDAMFIALIVLIVFSPVMIRYILSVRQMEDKALERALQEVGLRSGVKNPSVFVWNTHNRLMNAFAIGIILRPKTIILTDALITNLTQKELLAVAGHEFAHHKYSHLVFLFLAMFCALNWSDYLLQALNVNLVSGYVQIAQLICIIVTYILVSRLFESQADAYAVVDISKASGSEKVTSEAVQYMSSSLSALAFAGNISVERNDLLHRSIQERQQHLDTLIDCPIGQLPINRKVKWLKIGVVFFLVLGIVV